MTSRFYQETPCEHGNTFCFEWLSRPDGRYKKRRCLGAFRIELFPATPNYEAAWDSYYELANRRRESGLVEMQVRQVLDAALAGVVLLQEP